MDDLPDIEIPATLPRLNSKLRWFKRFERASIEITNLFDRASREHELEKFQQKWSIQERESAARQLVIRELWRRVGPPRAFQIATMRLLPGDMNTRAWLYQERVLYEQRVEAYRRQLGLPPRDQSSQPSPP